MGEIVGRCRKVIQDHYGSRFAGLVLYGSAARGEESSSSDIDLLVLLESPFDYFEELRCIVELLYPLQLDCDHLLSARPAPVEEYERGSLQLYRNARRDGVSS